MFVLNLKQLMSSNNLNTRVKEFIYVNINRSSDITRRVALPLRSMSEHIFLLSLRVVYFGPQQDCLAGTEDNSVFFSLYMGRSLETGLQKKGQ